MTIMRRLRGACSPAGVAALMATAMLLLLLVPPCLAADPPVGRVYRLAIIPFYTPEKIWQLYKPLVDYLNASTRSRWELVLGKTHDELVEELCRNQVDLVLLGPIPFARALERCRVRPALLSLGVGGAAHYSSVIVTVDPSIRTVADLKGKKFGYFEKSTAAHYFPLKMLAEAGISPADLTLVPFPSQDRIISAILSNQVAAGGVKDSLLEAFKSSRLRLLKESEPLANFVFATSPDLPEAVEREFVGALMRVNPLKNPADRELVKGWDQEMANGFALPPADFREQATRLLRGVAPFMK